MKIDRTSLPRAVAFGVASLLLFVSIFAFADELVEMARRTRQGEKIYFLVPISVAFLVSFVHGAFTHHFWETLGLKPAKKLQPKKDT